MKLNRFDEYFNVSIYITFLYRMNQSERNGTTFHSFQEKISVSISLSKFPVMDKK